MHDLRLVGVMMYITDHHFLLAAIAYAHFQDGRIKRFLLSSMEKRGVFNGQSRIIFESVMAFLNKVILRQH
jgi:hypothetical protein